MCVYSAIGDYFRDRAPKRYPFVPWEDPMPNWPLPLTPTGPSQAEFDQLKKEMEELKELLKAAQKFDKNTGHPDCEVDDKVEFIRKAAEYVGVDVDEVFGKKAKRK